MKTTTLILAVLTLSIFSMGTTNAASKKAISEIATNAQLKEALQYMFNWTPMVDLMGNDNECNLSVQFTINKNHELTDIKVNGNNEEMVRYAYLTLSRAKLPIAESLEQNKFTVDLHFILKGK
jgi:hypothetical protein